MKYKNKYPKPEVSIISLLAQTPSYSICPASFYPNVQMDVEDQLEPVLFCMAVWGESRGESQTGQKAVAQVIMNRVERKEGYWGFTVRQVLTDHNSNGIYEFSCFNPADPNYKKIMKPDAFSWISVCRTALPIYFAPTKLHDNSVYFYKRVMQEPGSFHEGLKMLFVEENHAFYTDL